MSVVIRLKVPIVIPMGTSKVNSSLGWLDVVVYDKFRNLILVCGRF